MIKEKAHKDPEFSSEMKCSIENEIIANDIKYSIEININKDFRRIVIKEFRFDPIDNAYGPNGMIEKKLNTDTEDISLIIDDITSIVQAFTAGTGIAAHERDYLITAIANFLSKVKPLINYKHMKFQVVRAGLLKRTSNEGMVRSEDLPEVESVAISEENLEHIFNIGCKYLIGRDMERDEAEAVKWFRLAADNGHAQSQEELGRMYEFGRGVSKDIAEATKWYSRAENQGRGAAKERLNELLSFSNLTKGEK